MNVRDKTKVMTAFVLVLHTKKAVVRCRLGGWPKSAELNLLILYPEICRADVDIPTI